MSDDQKANQGQVALWNEAAGRTWVEMQHVLDRVFTPFEMLLIQEAFPGEGGRALDIGCGAGATSLAMARQLGPTGLCLGVDVSEPLLTAAKARAAAEGIRSAAFMQADAQTYVFEAGNFDSVISRFGVMFFDDAEAAFTNIKRAVRPRAKLTFAAWRSPADNPFMTTAARAAEPLLPKLSMPDPGAPGQFAFADETRVQRILDASGWKNIEVRPIDVPGKLSEQELPGYITKLGPVGLALREEDESTRARTLDAILPAFKPFIQNGMAHFTMACWLVNAHA